jgi:pimeloyl-ACP methyl ester carboxylesterase
MSMSAMTASSVTTPASVVPAMPTPVTFGSIMVDGLNIAYREAGDPSNPKLVLLHGFPASSHQYRNLVRALGDKFHVIAPDYPGFGNSDTPDPSKYGYTFDKLAEVVEHFLAIKGFVHYGLFVQDYGGPVGFRILGAIPRRSIGWSSRTPTPTRSASPPRGTVSAAPCGRIGHPRPRRRSPAF